MSERIVNRRDLIKAGFAAGIGAGVACTGGGTSPGSAGAAQSVLPAASTRFPAPPEAATLNSKEYGRKRIERVQAALKKAGYDALVISNRALDYISYVSNYHPSAMQSGVAFVPAEGAPTRGWPRRRSGWMTWWTCPRTPCPRAAASTSTRRSWGASRSAS